jgi:DNA-binding response OmpR family regulator
LISGKVLVLEDDELFNETISEFLEDEGFSVVSLLDPITALEATYNNNFDLYILDINLPYESGIVFLENLRKSGDTTPAIFLTSREDKESLKKSFISGGDDFIRKPVDLDELLYRVQAILKRVCRQESIDIYGYKLNFMAKTLQDKSGNIIQIKQKAVELLILLVEANGEIVAISQIKNQLWPPSKEPSDGVIRVYITQLKKIFGEVIENIRGRGYRMLLKDRQ